MGRVEFITPERRPFPRATAPPTGMARHEKRAGTGRDGDGNGDRDEDGNGDGDGT